MAYKLKPNKSIAKRFKVTATGKLKHHHCYTSHLMSSRPANKRRKLRGSAVLAEGISKYLRKFMLVNKSPGQIRHEREIAARELASAETPAQS